VCQPYFASVGDTLLLLATGLRLTGVAKTATWMFPQHALSTLEMENKREHRGLLGTGPNSENIMTFVWTDKDRQYSIFSTSSLSPGVPYSQDRWWQVDTSPNSDAEREILTTPQPAVAEIYYDSCAKIDQRNHCQQGRAITVLCTVILYMNVQNTIEHSSKLVRSCPVDCRREAL
jgi:hypothetical protein